MQIETPENYFKLEQERRLARIEGRVMELLEELEHLKKELSSEELANDKEETQHV